MASKRSGKVATRRDPQANPRAVRELLAVERQLAELEQWKKDQFADYRARKERLTSRRLEILAELRGEGRQLALDVDPETGEVLS